MNQLHNRCLAILLAVAIALAAPLSGAIQYSTAVRNAQLDALETTIGTSPVLKIFDGTKPANCAAADAGTVLVTMTLPSDWMDAASSGSKSKLGTWSGTVSDAGTAQYFRIYATGGSTCHIQGSVTGSGSGAGDVGAGGSGDVAQGADVAAGEGAVAEGDATQDPDAVVGTAGDGTAIAVSGTLLAHFSAAWPRAASCTALSAPGAVWRMAAPVAQFSLIEN